VPQTSTAVILNPRAAHGRAGKRWSTLKHAIENRIGSFTTFVTTGRGHASTLARQVASEGFSRVVGIGGDGTQHEIVNGLIQSDLPINPELTLVVLPCGSGSDLAKTLHVAPGTQGLGILDSDTSIQSDVGKVVYTTADHTQCTRYFINVSHIGMGGLVAHRVDGIAKFFGGFLGYQLSILSSLVTYRNPLLELDVDGRKTERRCRDIIIANGQYDGGGMYVAPHGRLDSGTLEIYVLRDFSRTAAVRNMPLLYTGRLGQRADLAEYVQAKRIEASSPENVLLNIDGEPIGALPAVFEILPGRLKVAVPQ